MHAPRSALLVAALLLTTSVDLFAQQEPPVVVGDRVRVSWLGNAPMVCNVRAFKADTLVVDVEDLSAPLELPITLVKKVEVSRQRSNAGRGALTGGLIGAAVGSIFGVLVWSDSPSNPCTGSLFSNEPCTVDWGPEAVPVFAGILGGVGAGVGLLIGAASHSERWQEVPLERLEVSLTPNGRRALAVSVSVAF